MHQGLFLRDPPRPYIPSINKQLLARSAAPRICLGMSAPRGQPAPWIQVLRKSGKVIQGIHQSQWAAKSLGRERKEGNSQAWPGRLNPRLPRAPHFILDN